MPPLAGRREPALDPIILVSAKAGDDDRVAGLALADDYLTKPVRPRELVARVSRLIAARNRAMPAEAPPRPKRTTSETVVASLYPGARSAAASDSGPADAGAEARSAAGVMVLEADSEGTVSALAPVLDSVDQRKLLRIDQTIEAHLAEPSFGVIELAAALALSRRQLQRDLRELTARSPSEYLRGARMSAAERRLRSGARETVAEVAADVGLSPAYFSRLYSAWFGRAPSEDLGRGDR